MFPHLTIHLATCSDPKCFHLLVITLQLTFLFAAMNLQVVNEDMWPTALASNDRKKKTVSSIIITCDAADCSAEDGNNPTAGLKEIKTHPSRFKSLIKLIKKGEDVKKQSRSGKPGAKKRVKRR